MRFKNKNKAINAFFVILILSLLIGCSNEAKTEPPQNSGNNDKKSDTELPGELSLLETYFSDPSKVIATEETTIIVDNLKRYIGAAVKGSDIYLNIYTFKDKSIAEVLDRADDRGVNVHVMVDSSSSSKWEGNKPVADFLKKNLNSSPNSEFVGINNDISVNHHKHAAFSEIKLEDKIIKNIVFSMSGNFTTGQYKILQDALILGGNKGLYEAIVSNWNIMKGFRISGTGENFKRNKYTADNGNIIFEFLPMREKGKWNGHHPFIDMLNKIEDTENVKIKIGQSLWENSKSQMDLANLLIDMQKEGAQVEIILSRQDRFDDKILDTMEQLEKEGGDVLFLNATSYPAMHSKYMMIKGSWGDKKHKWVMAGTTNFTDNAVQRAYDLITFTKYKEIYDSYERNFKKIQEIYSK